LAMRDDLVWAKIGLARCNIVAGQMDDARVIVQDVLAQNKQFIAAYDLMAQIDEAQGNQEGALEALTKSSEIIPSARRSRLVGDVAY
ncbi:tetratricopeptide repeat protein, partial [Salmonella enterica]